MADRPEPPDPALERLARAVEVGTFRALARFTIYLVVLWLVLIVGVPLVLTASGMSLAGLLFIAIVIALALLALLASRALRPRI